MRPHWLNIAAAAIFTVAALIAVVISYLIGRLIGRAAAAIALWLIARYVYPDGNEHARYDAKVADHLGDTSDTGVGAE